MNNIGESDDSLFSEDDVKEGHNNNNNSSSGEGEEDSIDDTDSGGEGTTSSSYEGSGSGSSGTTGSDGSESDDDSDQSSHSTNELQDDDDDDDGNIPKDRTAEDESLANVDDRIVTATDANIDAFLNGTFDGEDAPEVRKDAPGTTVTTKTETLPSPTTPPTTPLPQQKEGNASLLLLISRQSLDRTVQQDQQRATTILDSMGIPYGTVDGADPVHREERNALFELSGLGAATYPQFFLVRDGGERAFYGTMELFVRANEEGWLAEDLGIKPTSPSKQVLLSNNLPTSTTKPQPSPEPEPEQQQQQEEEEERVPFMISNAEEILSRPTPAEQQSGTMITPSLHEQNELPLFTGEDETMEHGMTPDVTSPEQNDEDTVKDKDTTASPITKKSLVQTVVQLWGNISSSSSMGGGGAKEKNTSPRDLPEELPHVKGIVDDMDTAVAKEAQAKAEHDRMVQQMKEENEMKRAAKLAARRQQEEKERGNGVYSSNENERSDENANDDDGNDHRNGYSHDDGEDPSEFQDEGYPEGDNREAEKAKPSIKKSPWASLRNLFGRGKKKEEDQSPLDDNKEQDPLSLGKVRQDEEDEAEDNDQLFDQQKKLDLSNNGLEIEQGGDGSYSFHGNTHKIGDRNGPNERTQESQQVEQQVILVNTTEPWFGDDSSRDRNDGNEDTGSKSSKQPQENDQRDISEVEPFLDEEHGLEGETHDQHSQDRDHDWDERGMNQQEKQTPCSLYVFALLIGEIVGVLIGWYVWPR